MSQITLAFASTTFLLFAALLYLWIKHPSEKKFFYAGLFFLCSTIILFGLYAIYLGIFTDKIVFLTKFIYIGAFA